jgi:hypothetical protein
MGTTFTLEDLAMALGELSNLRYDATFLDDMYEAMATRLELRA